MIELLTRFETKAPEVVFEWHDSETPAKGWVVINSLRGGAAGGGECGQRQAAQVDSQGHGGLAGWQSRSMNRW